MTIHKTISALTVVTILSGCQTWTVSDWSNVNQPKTAVAVKTEDGRYIAVAPGCPDWTSRPGRTWANTVHSNFGCASATNFARMLADPADLARGRDMGPADGTVQADAMRRYRTGETKALLGASATGGAFDASSGE